MEVMLADLSGPVVLSLQGTAVDTFLKLQNENAREDGKLKKGQAKQRYLLAENVRISDMHQNNYNVNVLTTMKVLNSVSEGPVRAGTLPFQCNLVPRICRTMSTRLPRIQRASIISSL